MSNATQAPSGPLDSKFYAREIVALCGAIAAALWFLVSPSVFDLHAPIFYSGDGHSHALVVKTIIDVGWFPVHSSWIGAPFGADLVDYPFSDGLNFLLIRVLSLFSSDWVVVTNLFYLAGYFLSGVSAFVVFRLFGIGSAWAFAGALLFTFLPYHWMRHGHLLLASYAVVPLGVWLAFIAWRGSSHFPRPFSNRKFVGGALLIAAVGSAGAYYAFFASFFVVVAGAGRVLATRSLREFMPAFAIAMGIAVVVLLNVTPSLLYKASHGANPEVAERLSVESEVFGLRLTQLVLPHALHRVGAMREVAERYATSAPLVNENATAALGLAGTAGLVLLGFVALRQFAGATASMSPLSFLAVIAMAGFFLGTIGGGGSLFALFVSPTLRGYNRISVYIAFVSLAGLLVAMQMWSQRYRHIATTWTIAAAAAALALIGLLDQTPREYRKNIDASFASDRAFVHRAESLLPAGTMVWQLPYQPFPESGPIEKMQDYGLLRGYLNSTALRWSYGAVKGREADRWIRTLKDRPPAEQLELAARSGFGAVYVDRRGFADQGVDMERILRERLGPPLAQSDDGFLAIYRLQPTGASAVRLEELLPPVDTPIRFDLATLGGLVARVTGLSGWEPWGRWSDGSAVRVELARELPSRFSLRIETVMALQPSVGVDLGVRIGGVAKQFRVSGGATVVEIPFELEKPGKVIEIHIPEPRSPRELGMSDDSRKLGIGLRSITVLPAVLPVKP